MISNTLYNHYLHVILVRNLVFYEFLKKLTTDRHYLSGPDSIAFLLMPRNLQDLLPDMEGELT